MSTATVFNSAGSSFTVTNAVLNSAGTSFDVGNDVLDSDGNAFTIFSTVVTGWKEIIKFTLYLTTGLSADAHIDPARSFDLEL